MNEPVTLEQVLKLARQLPLPEKIRLIEKMVPSIQRELRRSNLVQRHSLRGLWRGLDITPDEIDQARREMW